jgi:hypothetical protein
VPAGTATTCTAKVNGSSTARPKGVMTFTSSRGSGFPTTKCSLVLNTAPGAPANQGTCSVQYTPPGAGFDTRKDTITAQYTPGRLGFTLGSGFEEGFRAGSGQTQVSVPSSLKPKPTMDLSCSDPTPAGSTGYCTLLVYNTTPVDISDYPTGTVKFTSTRPKGMNAGNSTCTLTTHDGIITPPYSDCTISYIPPDTGYPSRVDTITATYQGDGRYGSATDSFGIGVPKAAGAAN